MKPVRILIVDDHMLFRQGVRSAIERQADIEVVGEAGDGRDALSEARELKPDLILMDIGLPHCDGLEALSVIKDALPGTKIVMLTVHDDDENLFAAVKRGAEGFLCKNVRTQDLVDAVRGVMGGEAALSKHMAARILKEFARLAEMEVESTVSQLTPREKEVLQKLSEGLSNKEIAHALYISENTVKAHVTHVLRKLHLENRSQAAAYVQRWGLSGIN